MKKLLFVAGIAWILSGIFYMVVIINSNYVYYSEHIFHLYDLLNLVLTMVWVFWGIVCIYYSVKKPKV